MQYIIYCDESEDKGFYYSNFYGGVLLRASDRAAVEAELAAAKGDIWGEVKWTKINAHNAEDFIRFADTFLTMAENGRVKIRIMFTQNINRTDHVETYEEDATFFKLYYQFIKHAFGLKHCRQDQQNATHISIFLDDAPDTAEKLDNFKNYLSSLSFLPDFFQAGVVIDKQDIAEVDSKQHIILQAVDVLLGAIQFKLNDHNRVIPPAKRRGNRTKAKHRVYRFINTRLRQMRPGFNVGGTTGHPDGEKSRWLMPYRHWCFRPYQSVQDRTYGKKKKKRKK